VPGPELEVCTVLAPTNRAVGLVVVIEPLLLIAPLPVALAVTSKGLTGSMPLYSKTRMSGKLAGELKVTVRILEAALAAEMALA